MIACDCWDDGIESSYAADVIGVYNVNKNITGAGPGVSRKPGQQGSSFKGKGSVIRAVLYVISFMLTLLTPDFGPTGQLAVPVY